MITLPKLCHVLGALIVLSGLSTARLNADSATTYELIQSGQATRSGFYGLAGELHSPLPAESYQLKAIGSMQTGAVVSIIGKIPASGLYIIELPILPLPHWEVCLIRDDKIVAGPVKIDVARPGMGIDWALSADATAAATAAPTSAALEIHPNGPWNRNVTRAIVAMNETSTGRKWPESLHQVPYPKQPPAKVLGASSSDKDPLKRTAQNVDSLEDATLIRLADRYPEHTRSGRSPRVADRREAYRLPASRKQRGDRVSGVAHQGAKSESGILLRSYFEIRSGRSGASKRPSPWTWQIFGASTLSRT